MANGPINQHKQMAMGRAVPQGKGTKQLAKGGPFNTKQPKEAGCGCGGSVKKGSK